MLRYTVALCLIAGSLGQWVNPDWLRSLGGSNQGNKRFPPLPGSIPLGNKRWNPSLMNFDVTSTTPTTPPYSTPPTTSPPPPGTCSSVFSCADCNTAQVCHPSGNGLIPAMKVPCPPTAPFCQYSSGTCSNVPDYAHCGNPDNFICMNNGYYPDPSNCSIYHVCNDYIPQMFFCANGQVYNADDKECTSPTKYTCNTVDCTTVNTNTDTGVKGTLGNTHYYAYCNQGKPLVVDRCPHEYKLNVTSQLCEAICESDGLMRDVTNCLNFYKCSTIYINATTPVIVRENLPCPTNEAFDPSSYQCVPKSMTDCGSKPPTTPSSVI